MAISLPQVKNPNGIVIYHGPDALNGKDIVVIATGLARKSANPKTGGDTIQTWILPADMNPLDAYSAGKDNIVCGNCKHRSTYSGGWGTCYVNVYQAPYQVWNAWKRGSYAELNEDTIKLFDNRIVRLGSYGDPAFVPTDVWIKITNNAIGFLGYTHQWNHVNIDLNLQSFCMASADSEVEKYAANAMGWRTFRVRTEDEDLVEGEFICPASEEAGKKKTCEECKACRGGIHSRKGEPVIIAHGRKWKVDRYTKIQKQRKNKKKYTHLLKAKGK